MLLAVPLAKAECWGLLEESWAAADLEEAVAVFAEKENVVARVAENQVAAEDMGEDGVNCGA